jgi:sirohydrochlorin ferrochelatase
MPLDVPFAGGCEVATEPLAQPGFDAVVAVPFVVGEAWPVVDEVLGALGITEPGGVAVNVPPGVVAVLALVPG